MSENILVKFKKSPSFSFRGNFNNNSLSNNPSSLPSPNHYTPQKPIKNQIKIVFTKSLRKTFFDKIAEKSPGPGQYETNILKDRSYSSLKYAKNRTFTERFVYKSYQKPGPGAYEIKKDFKKTLPSFSISKKTKTIHYIYLYRNSFKQAPGAYDIQSKLSRTSSVMYFFAFNYAQFQDRHVYSIKKIHYLGLESIRLVKISTHKDCLKNKRKEKGFSCRKRFGDNLKGDYIPGPGNYETKSEISFRSTYSMKMPKALRDTLAHINGRNSTPGPGNYENLTYSYSKLNFKSHSAPKFSKAKLDKISAIKMDTTDKFYDAKITMVKKSSSSYSIGAEKRKSLFEKISKLPGPGDYNHHETESVKESILAPKFPKSLRSNPILNKLVVGPGQYFNPESSSSFSRTGTKFSKGYRKTDFSHLYNQAKSIIRISNSSHLQNIIPLTKR